MTCASGITGTALGLANFKFISMSLVELDADNVDADDPRVLVAA